MIALESKPNIKKKPKHIQYLRIYVFKYCFKIKNNMIELSFKVNNLHITRKGGGEKGEKPLTLDELLPLAEHLISAQYLLYIQNHINYPSFRYFIKSELNNNFPEYKEKVKYLLGEMIMVRETLLSIGDYTLLFRSLPEMPTLRNNEHYIQNPKNHLQKALRDQEKPIQDREVYLIENSSCPKKLSLEPLDPLLRWLFLNQADNLVGCAKKHGWKEVLFYIPQSKQEPYVRGLWITPLNDHRDPPAKERAITIGAYRYGSEFLYCATSV